MDTRPLFYVFVEIRANEQRRLYGCATFFDSKVEHKEALTSGSGRSFGEKGIYHFNPRIISEIRKYSIRSVFQHSCNSPPYLLGAFSAHHITKFAMINMR